MNKKLLTIVAVATTVLSACYQQSDKAADERYQVSSSGLTVTDNVTNLEWSRCAEGQDFDELTNSCTGEPERLSLEDAIKLASTANNDGKSQWRVPTIAELRTIRYCHEKQQILGNHDFVRFPCHESDEAGKDRKHPNNKVLSPTLNPIAFPSDEYKGYQFWSSDVLSYNDQLVWFVDFRTGQSLTRGVNAKWKLRLVRNY